LKQCRDCLKMLPLSDFPRRGGQQAGVLESRCVSCFRENNRKKARKSYHRKPVVKRTKSNRAVALMRYHGITVEQFDALYAKQGNVCAICGSATEKPHVDHCHETDIIRGILCSPCNTAIGLLGDDPDRMRRAAEYVSQTFPPDALRSVPGMPSGAKRNHSAAATSAFARASAERAALEADPAPQTESLFDVGETAWHLTSQELSEGHQT
jgi:hypothetical protein